MGLLVEIHHWNWRKKWHAQKPELTTCPQDCLLKRTSQPSSLLRFADVCWCFQIISTIWKEDVTATAAGWDLNPGAMAAIPCFPLLLIPKGTTLDPKARWKQRICAEVTGGTSSCASSFSYCDYLCAAKIAIRNLLTVFKIFWLCHAFRDKDCIVSVSEGWQWLFKRYLAGEERFPLSC